MTSALVLSFVSMFGLTNKPTVPQVLFIEGPLSVQKPYGAAKAKA